MSILNKLRIVEKYLLLDLIELEKNTKGIFNQLYVERDSEIDRFVSLIDLFQEKGLNLIISAEAGVGKTHFISNLMINDYLKNDNLYYMNIDYRKLDDETQDGLQMFFINEMIKYFDDISEPFHLIDNTHEKIISNLKLIFEHFNYCHKNNENSKHLVVILDDLDYVEEELWPTITNSFLAYAKSKSCSMIISCRPPLEAAFKTDPRTKKFLYNPTQSKHIKLHPIDLSKILLSRLNYVYTNSNTTIQKIMQISLGFDTSIENKHLPLGVKHLNFIKMFSNGNIREMLHMFIKNLKFVIDNRKTFKVLDDGNIDFKRENILKLYYDDADIECCKIININEQKSRKAKNSLYYNLLIAISDRKIVDEDLIGIFEDDLKFKRDDVIKAILLLSNNEHRILHPEAIGSEDKKLAISKDIFRAYKLSSRGKFYIENINDWDEYKTRVGEIKNVYSEYVDSINSL